MKTYFNNLCRNFSFENFSRFNYLPKGSQILFISFIVVFATLFMSYIKEEEIPMDSLPVFGTCLPLAIKGGIVQSSNDKTVTYQANGGNKIIIDQKKNANRGFLSGLAKFQN